MTQKYGYIHFIYMARNIHPGETAVQILLSTTAIPVCGRYPIR